MKKIMKEMHTAGISGRTVVSRTNLVGSALRRTLVVYPDGKSEASFWRGTTIFDGTYLPNISN